MEFLGAGKARRINYGLVSIFIISVVVFICAYLPIQFKNCSQTINRSPNFIDGSNCYCLLNLGASNAIGAKVIIGSEWGQQFSKLDPTTTLLTTYDSKGAKILISTDSIQTYLNYYWAVEWTNKLITADVNMFGFQDNLNLTTLPRFPYACLIAYNSSFGTFYNTTDECVSKITSYIPEFNQFLNISYVNNPILQNYCQIDYCEVDYCPGSQVTNLILFCCSIAAFIYSILRIARTLIFRYLKLHENPEEKRIFPVV